MDKDYQVSNSTQMQQAGSRQTYVQECDSEEASWRPTMQTRGSPIHHPMLTNVGMPTTTRLEHYSSVCSEPLAQFNHIGHSFSNVISQNSDHGEESRVGADFFKMAEDLLESRSTKSRDFEVYISSTPVILQTFQTDRRLKYYPESTRSVRRNLIISQVDCSD